MSSPEASAILTTESATKAQELQRAFDMFNQVSQELTQAYAALQGRVESLTKELAVANGELRRQYQEKEALSERLSLLLNALPGGVVALDSESVVSEVNPAALAMFGAEMVGQRWQTLVTGRLEATEAPDEWQLGDRRISIGESTLDSFGGKLLLLHDITAAHELKANVERSQRLAAMGEMAASLAHQLRTPLAAALLYSANLTQADLPANARVRFAEKVTSQLQRLERLIQEVLLFTRGESIGRDVLAAEQLVFEAAQTIEPLCAEKGVYFAVDCALTTEIVTGSRKALVGALINLLENALQACEGNTESRRSVFLSAYSDDGKEVTMSVRDTGAGIPKETLSRIFEPFYTTKGQGTGLGLAIAQGVAKAHGGRIEAHSEQGVGSEFLIHLPTTK